MTIKQALDFGDGSRDPRIRILFVDILTVNVPQNDRFLWHFSHRFFLAYPILGLLDEK